MREPQKNPSQNEHISYVQGREKEFLEVLIQSLDIGVSILDKDLRYQLISDAVYSNTHISKDDLKIGSTLQDCHEAMFQNGMLTPEIMERNHLYATEQESRKQTGENIETQIVKLGDGTSHEFVRKELPNGLTVSMAHDITELVEKDEMLEAALSLGHAGYWIYDFASKRYQLSQSLREVLSKDEIDQILGKGIISIIHPDDRADFKAAIQTLSKSNTQFNVISRMNVKSGFLQWARMTGELIRDSQGQSARIRVFVQDITRERQRADLLEKAKDEAIAANQAKSQFLANMSHEIRTPMNGILGMAELLASTPVSERQKEFIDVINNSATALLTIINDILDFSKIEADAMTLDPTPFNLKTMVNDIAGLFHGKAQEKDLEIIINYPTNLPTAFIGDHGRIRQIITNLISNAIKFTDDGHITFQVNVTQQDNIAFVSLDVIDTGIGVVEEKLPQIFEKFTQADGSTTRVYGGTGLGLTICKRIVELMDGRMKVSSEYGKGSSFGFVVPLPIDEDATIDVPDIGTIRGKSALIIDDIEVNRQVLSEQISSWGVAPLTASTPENALLMIKDYLAGQQQIDFILLDFQMPSCNGIELAEKIHNLCDGRPPVMIMLSSCDQEINSNELASVGIEQYLVKPVRETRLLETIQDALSLTDVAPTPIGRTVVNPTIQTHSPEQPAEPAQQIPAQNTKTEILVAEDFPLNREVVKLMLEETDYVPVFVENGLEAVNTYKADPHKYPIILMDVSMPVMDGHDATRHIREYETENNLAAIPVIALTGHAMGNDRELCLEAGMNDYLTKPVRHHDLINMLGTYLAADNSDIARSA